MQQVFPPVYYPEKFDITNDPFAPLPPSINFSRPEVPFPIPEGQFPKQENLPIHPASAEQSESNLWHLGKWRSHELTPLEVPALSFIPRCFYICRNALMSCLNATRFRMFGTDFTWAGIFFVLAVIGATVALLVIYRDDGALIGHYSCIPLAITFSLSTHNNIWTLLFGASFERALTVHKIIAFFAVIAGAFHGAWTYFQLGIDYKALTGLILTILMALMLVNSFYPIRRNFYQLFYVMHFVTAIGIVVMVVLHEAYWVFIGIGLWVLDWICRLIIQCVIQRKATRVEILRISENLVRLSFANPRFNFRYFPGQYCFIRIPKIGFLEKAHPFSIASAPHQSNVIFYIKNDGDWTKRLLNLSMKANTVDAEIEGPYGSWSINAQSPKYKIFAFISGGIGVTPMKSICQHLVSERHRGREIKKIMFIWTLRETNMVASILSEPDDYLTDFKKISQLVYPVTEPNGFVRQEKVLDVRIFSTAKNAKTTQPRFIYSGRPDIEKLLTELAFTARSLGERNVAVFACGPAQLVDNATTICKKLSGSQGISFDIHSERFDF